MDKDLVERTRKTLQDIADMLKELDDYMVQLKAETEQFIEGLQQRTLVVRQLGEPPTKGIVHRGIPHSWPPTTTVDTRDPYLSGRQPRRDGDSYGSVSPLTPRGGAHGQKGEDIRKR